MTQEINLDLNNARVHDNDNKSAIKSSLAELGAGRSIVIDNNNVIIGGNGVFEEAQSLGIPVKIIESDGSELVAIKRTDLSTDDAKRKALALADNKTGDLSFFDDNKVAELLNEIDSDKILYSTGFSADEINELLSSIDGLEIEDGFNQSKTDVETVEAADSNCTIGPYRFTIPRKEYEEWIENIRQEVGFDDNSINQELKRRLKLCN